MNTHRREANYNHTEYHDRRQERDHCIIWRIVLMVPSREQTHLEHAGEGIQWTGIYDRGYLQRSAQIRRLAEQDQTGAWNVRELWDNPASILFGYPGLLCWHGVYRIGSSGLRLQYDCGSFIMFERRSQMKIERDKLFWIVLGAVGIFLIIGHNLALSVICKVLGAGMVLSAVFWLINAFRDKFYVFFSTDVILLRFQMLPAGKDNPHQSLS